MEIVDFEVISDTIEADEAWWPPTLTSPSDLGRRWLALWTIQHASHNSRASTCFSRATSPLSAMVSVLPGFPP